jgi:hypothetical protein
MDYLEQLGLALGGKISKQNSSNVNFQVPSYRKLKIGLYKGVKVEIEEYGAFAVIGIAVDSDLAFSINNPDRLSQFTFPVILAGQPYTIYASARQPLVEGSMKTFLDAAGEHLRKLELQSEETAFVYDNHVYFALHFGRNILAALEDIITLFECNEEIFRRERTPPRISKKNIPEKLWPLVPLLKKWAISDDSEREERKEIMGKAAKRKLLNAVTPLMPEINGYLDSFGDRPFSEEAILIGNLAELVSELQLEE